MGWITKRIKIPNKKKHLLSSKDLLKNPPEPKLDLDRVQKLREQRKEKSSVTFLIDENVLGIDRYLSSFSINYRKVGDPDCPPLGSDDPTVAKFAKENSLVVVTNDDKLLKQCEPLDVNCVFIDLRDLARKVKSYADSH